MKKKNTKAIGSGTKARKISDRQPESRGARDPDVNTFRMYLRDIDRFPLLSKEEEKTIAELAAQGDKAAQDRLVNANLRFVISVAKRYQGKGLSLQDLISEGNIGLLNAARNFRVEMGYRFITYAVWWIRQAIGKAIFDSGRFIRLPSNKAYDVMRIEKTLAEIQNENEAGWDYDAEIRSAALALDMVPEKAANLVNISQDVLSLDDPTAQADDSLTIKDTIVDEYFKTPDENAVNSVVTDDIEAALKGLGDRAANIIRYRFGLGDYPPMTLKEVGDRYNITRERVRQIEQKALLQLQRSSRNNNLQSYLAS